MRDIAFENMKKHGKKMSMAAAKKDGVGNILSVGSIVAVGIADVDRAKVDSTTITAVVVEIVECGDVRREYKYRLACRAGVLKTLRMRSYLKPFPNATPELMDLADVMRNWRSMPEVGERACSKFISSVGGQGMLRCSCTTTCNTNRCSCFKAGRECNSRCHKANSKCCNKMY